MTGYQKTVLTVMLTAVVTAGILSPMVSFSGKAQASSGGDCPSAINQIATLEQYGAVTIYYASSSWERQQQWSVSFKTQSDYATWKKQVDLTIEEKANTMCEAVDKLYYKVIEFPLPKSNWRRPQ